jgi:hypothetical protein
LTNLFLNAYTILTLMSASERFSSSATLAFANNSAYGTGGGGGGSTVGGKPVGGANGTITLFLDDLTAV